MQNTSHAVMAQRNEPRDSLDDFPTPPWATRGVIEHVIGETSKLAEMSCSEPACGAGHMAKVLREYFGTVHASDVEDYGYGRVQDFLQPHVVEPVDWIITNPPFKLAEEFSITALNIARRGVAILARTVFLESVGRYNRLFNVRRPSIVAQYVERVPMVKGRLDPKASTATGYAWIIWDKELGPMSRLEWIPPCRKTLEREGDYAPVVSTTSPLQQERESNSGAQLNLV